MSKTIGCVDDEGCFYFTMTFDMKDAEEVEEMIAILHNPDIPTSIESCDDHQVVVKVWLSPEDFNE